MFGAIFALTFFSVELSYAAKSTNSNLTCTKSQSGKSIVKDGKTYICKKSGNTYKLFLKTATTDSGMAKSESAKLNLIDTLKDQIKKSIENENPNTPSNINKKNRIPLITKNGLIFNFGAVQKLDIYEDVQCSYCQQFESVNGDIVANLINEGKTEVRYHLINLLGNESFLGANAALCAAPSGNFRNYINYLFENQPAFPNFGFWSSNFFLGAGLDLGISDQNFSSCVLTVKYKEIITSGNALFNALQLRGTPAVYFNDKQLTSSQIFDKNNFESLLGLNII